MITMESGVAALVPIARRAIGGGRASRRAPGLMVIKAPCETCCPMARSSRKALFVAAPPDKTGPAVPF